jgi:hypothetical protein
MRLRFGDCLLDTEAREHRLEDSRRELSPKVRGRRIEAPAELADGDEIGMGPVMLLFRAARGDSTTGMGTAR